VGGGPPDRPFSDRVDLRSRSAAASFRVPFSVLDGFAAIGLYFAGQLVAGLILGIGLAVLGADLEGAPLLVIALGAQVLGVSFALAYLLGRRRLSWRLLGPIRPSWLMVALGLAVGVGGTILAYALNAILALLFQPEAPVEQQVMQDLLAGGTSMWLAIIVAVIMAPLVEELLFRGVLFQAMRPRVGLWPAAVLSSLVFTLVHVEVITSQPLALTGLFTLGVVFAWAFHRTGSIVVPILGHAVFNGMSVLLAIAVDRLGLDELVALTAPLLSTAG
jgi:uncharacterized protein